MAAPFQLSAKLVEHEVARKSDAVEIIGSTNNVTDAAKKNLVRVIARSTFRPRVTAGRVAEDSPIVVRYYLYN